MVTVPRRRLCTNIEGTLQSALTLSRAVRSAATRTNTSIVPGWLVVHPKASELAEVREVQVVESQPGAFFPYILPIRANTTVVVEVGEVEVRSGESSLGHLACGDAPFFNPQGTPCEIIPTQYPTAVLLVSYRERQAGEQQDSP